MVKNDMVKFIIDVFTVLFNKFNWNKKVDCSIVLEGMGWTKIYKIVCVLCMSKIIKGIYW